MALDRFQCSFIFFAAAVALWLGGCSEEQDPSSEEFGPVNQQISPAHLPLMLDAMSLSSDGNSIHLTHEEVSGVKILDITDEAPDGSQTATVTFLTKQPEGNFRAKAKVTYKIQTVGAQGGGAIAIYPVSNVETLSIEKVEGP